MFAIQTGLAALALCGLTLAAAPAGASSFKVVYDFQGGADGANPLANLTRLGETLYGVTMAGGGNGRGTLFSFDLKTGKERVLHGFGAGGDGIAPGAGLLKRGDTLYGATESGGAAGWGTVFSLNLKTGAYATLYSFQGGAGDGANPQSDLIEANGLLYGTAMLGGSSNCYLWGCGTVFSIDPVTGAEKTVYFFQSGNDGSFPAGGLTRRGKVLYGATTSGGAGDCGTVFSLDPATGSEEVLHNFDRQGDGTTPGSGLMAVKGMLYGTTVEGGNGDPGVGVVYSFDPKTNTEQVVHAFEGGDGAIPEDSPVPAVGALFGTTSMGGANGNGAVFKLDPATGAFKVLHSFAGGDGDDPWAGLVQVGKRFYGVAYDGGSANEGVVFSIAP
jgi:uncharacterized repeat protein (TIGR03803 family)